MPKLRYLLTCYAIIYFHCLLSNAYAYKAGNMDIKLRAGIRENYDSNITYADTNVKSDISTNLFFGLNAEYGGKRRSLGLSGNINRQSFDRYGSFNNTSGDFTFNFLNEFSKYSRMTLSNSFLRAEEPRSFEDEFGKAGNRYSYYKNTFDAGYKKDITRQLSLTAGYSNEVYDYSRNDLQDSYLNKINTEVDYSLSSRTILLGSFEYLNKDFERSSNAQTERVAVGLRQYLTTQLYFDLRSGQDFIKSVDKKNSTGQYLSTSFTDEISENTVLKLSYLKENTTTNFSQSIFESQRLSLSMTKQLFKRLGFSLSAFYGKGEYAGQSISDKLKGVNSGFIYDISGNVKAGLNYNYSDTSSNVSTREYTKDVVSAGLTYKF